MSLPRIIEGHVKEILGENEELFQKRYAICALCPKKVIRKGLGEVCGSCNCRLQAKLRIPGEICPLEKWLPVSK